MESWKTSANVSKPCTACFLLREMPPTDTSGHQVCCVPSDAATVWSLKATRPFTKKISTESTSRQFQCVFFLSGFLIISNFLDNTKFKQVCGFLFFCPPPKFPLVCHFLWGTPQDSVILSWLVVLHLFSASYRSLVISTRVWTAHASPPHFMVHTYNHPTVQCEPPLTVRGMPLWAARHDVDKSCVAEIGPWTGFVNFWARCVGGWIGGIFSPQRIRIRSLNLWIMNVISQRGEKLLTHRIHL